jgi:membrane-bound lytic murein transglycosylase A
LAVGLGLGSCVRVPRPPPAPPPPTPPPANALAAGVRPGGELIGLDDAEIERLWQAFKATCPSLVTRQDASGLTRPEDWRSACDADGVPAGDIEVEADSYSRAEFHRQLLRRYFELVQVGDGAAFATGYYEPEIAGCRSPRPGCEVPIYLRPPDLLDANPQTGERGRGRVDEQGHYVLYYDRAAIEQGALAGRGLELAWAADPVDLFFLQIQGSGRLRMADGSVMRIGYAAQNGREYVAIGRLMRDRGLLQPPISMQRIAAWIHANPDAGRALMRENMSYVFFQELTGPPLGALGRPVTPRVTVAADPRFVPLGAPVLLMGMDNPAADGLWVAQDTGGAIRGANRFDTFWGAGEEAAATAGSMQSHGRAYILLPRGALQRIRDRAQAQR